MPVCILGLKFASTEPKFTGLPDLAPESLADETTDCSKVFHCPQFGHFPCQREVLYWQLEQIKITEDFGIKFKIPNYKFQITNKLQNPKFKIY
jgi:hypothetical protein